MAARQAGLHEIIAAMQPMTVRQVFYQASVRGIVDKTEQGYGRVQRDLVAMRLRGDLPFEWIADNTRWQRKRVSWSNPRKPCGRCKAYRRPMDDADEYVEVWLEKDALSAVVYDVRTPSTSR